MSKSPPDSSWMQWSRCNSSAEQPQDTPLLLGISESLREFRGISKVSGSIEGLMELDDQPGNPVERILNPLKPVGLFGLKATTFLTCILQVHSISSKAIFRWKPLYSAIMGAKNHSDWGTGEENLNTNRHVPMIELLKELQIVLAGLELSNRSYKSSISLHLAFLSYRKNFLLGIPSRHLQTI